MRFLHLTIFIIWAKILKILVGHWCSKMEGLRMGHISSDVSYFCPLGLS